jgi:arylsulfatase A-like enzyme
MVVDQLAPHRWQRPGGRVEDCALPSPEPAPGDAGLVDGVAFQPPPAFNEDDVSDKPAFIRGRDPYGPEQIEAIERTYRCGVAALRTVDRGVGAIWEALGEVGERRDTMLVFTSDNGFFYGEHRLHDDKQIPYRESVEVPLAIRLPAARGPAPAGLRVGELVANVDVPATILELADAQPCNGGACRTLDGRSLLGLARGDATGWPERRAIPLELDVDGRSSPDFNSCRYQGVWTARWVYVEHSSESGGPGFGCSPADEAELYDLNADPSQLTNLHPPPPGPLAVLEAGLAERAELLAGCAGIAGRDEPSPERPNCE